MKPAWQVGLENLEASYEAALLRHAREFLAQIEDGPEPVPIYEELDDETNDLVMEKVLKSLLR